MSLRAAGVAIMLLLGSVGCAPLTGVLERVGLRQEPVPAALLFQRECASCHGPLGRGDGPYARTFAAPAPDLLALAATSDRGRLATGILQGSPATGMPGFADVLSAREARSLVTFLAALVQELTAAPRDGPALFGAHCATCHGGTGDGAGPLAARLIPRPRDLTRSWYRFRSTPSGRGPVAGDLEASIMRGLGVTAMGCYRGLGQVRVARIVEHLGTLTNIEPDAAARPLVPPAGGGPDELARGRTLYDDARCWQCHGLEGRGDGPSARELRDSAGRGSLPANLRQRWRLKGGGDVASLARTIAYGMNGTPMPSYADVLTGDELWALARYVESLGADRPVLPETLAMHARPGPVPDDPAAAFWDDVPATRLPLGPQAFVAPRWSRPAIDAAAVAIAVSRDEVAVRVSWDDPFEDRGVEDRVSEADIDDPRLPGRWRRPDRLAVALAAVGPQGRMPPLDGTPTTSATRWVWSADDDALRVSSPEAGVLAGGASFAAGRWRVVVRAPRAAPPFVPGTRMALSVRLWEGAAGEQGTRHALSAWVPFSLPESLPAARAR